jgi:hypothetical protein
MPCVVEGSTRREFSEGRLKAVRVACTADEVLSTEAKSMPRGSEL